MRIFFLFFVSFWICALMSPAYASKPIPQWDIQSVDTMKMSRDLAKEKLYDKSFISEIDREMKNIADMGANYVAIDTPYDQEFLPYLTEWVHAARKYHLSVWFRGNFSGWEKWFGYKTITPFQHTQMIRSFISNNPQLFQDGDIFSSCPECENGVIKDPRSTGKITDYRKFLISEYQTSKSAFEKINRKVDPSFFSMNADVAKLIMDSPTTKALGGIVVVDHYVKDPEKFKTDLSSLTAQSNGNIFLGEFGAPIPDLQGEMTESQQAKWVQESLQNLVSVSRLVGVNYWVNQGGSTSIFHNDDTPKKAASVIKNFYTGIVTNGTVKDSLENPVGGIIVSSRGRTVITDDAGVFSLPYIPKNVSIDFTSKTFEEKRIFSDGTTDPLLVHLIKKKESVWFTVEKKIIQFIGHLRGK